jgi:hypothetical protein
MISSLLRSRKFWLAVLALVQTIIFATIPDFPPAVWQSIDALLIALILAYTVEDAAARREDKFHSLF